MSVQSKVGHLQIPNGSSSPVVVTGLGFTPQFVFFWMSGINSASANLTTRQSRVGCFGWGSSGSGASTGYCVNSLRDSQAINNSSQQNSNAQTGGSVEFQDGAHASSQWVAGSFVSGGFTLSKTGPSSTPWLSVTVHYLAIAGVTAINTGRFTSTADTIGSQSITGVGFKPDFVMCFGGGISFGMADASLNQISISAYSQDDDDAGTGEVSANSYIQPGTFLNIFQESFTDPNPIDAIADLASMDSDGFTIVWTQASLTAADPFIDYIAFEGSNAQVGTLATRTDTSPISVSTPNCFPKAAMFFSTCNPESTVGTPDEDSTLSIGAYDGTNQGAQASRNQAEVSTTNQVNSIVLDGCYTNPKSDGTQQGEFAASSLTGGITGAMSVPDPQANMVGFVAFGDAPPPPVSVSHGVDMYVLDGNRSHGVDIFVDAPTDRHHNVDLYVLAPGVITDQSHGVDLFVEQRTVEAVNLSGFFIFSIRPTAYVKLAASFATPALSFVQLAADFRTHSEGFVELAGRFQKRGSAFTKLAGSFQRAGQSHNVDLVVSTPNVSFVSLAASFVQPLRAQFCGGFPDASYVRLAAWFVTPGGSTQMPGTPGFTAADDFLSAQVALAAYKPISIISLAGFSLIVTAFTSGVISWQTRARSWLTRLDEAPGGVLLTTTVNTHTLPNGDVITTTTTVKQVQDATITTVVITDSGTPERVSTIVTETTKSGQTTTQESETNTINGVINTQTKKTVSSQPPETENIQPIQVRTLDGNIHYQFFDQDNPAWAGGEQEGVTNSAKQVSVGPGTLNGQTTDQFGNPILERVTVETVTTPDGKVINTNTTEVGINDVGTTVTATESSFTGIQTTTTKKVTHPDGSQDVTVTVVNDITGDSTETSTEVTTDEFGQVTTTVTQTETKTFPDPVTNVIRQTITKTVTVTKSGVSTTDVTVETSNDFDDAIIGDKFKTIFIQELTISCVIDEQTMYGLSEYNISHQKQFALQDLFTQLLGNAKLSYALRQSFIQQFNDANCVKPLTLQANGKVFNVVFAPSASAFRAKYIPGTEPHVYELQLILQERSDLINGATGF
jgi:hypothetical protein